MQSKDLRCLGLSLFESFPKATLKNILQNSRTFYFLDSLAVYRMVHGSDSIRIFFRVAFGNWGFLWEYVWLVLLG